MKNILIPVELQHPEDQIRTVIYSAELAAELNMGLLFAFISDPDAYGYAAMWSMDEVSTRFNPARKISEQEEEIEKTLIGYQQEISELLDPVPPMNFLILSHGNTEKLLSQMEKFKIEFVIVCRSNLADRPFLSFDNINEQMLIDGHTPVIVHPPDKEFTPINKILFGTNFHPFDLDVLSRLSRLFDKHKTEITAMHITEDLNFEKQLKKAGYLKRIKSEIQNKNLNVNTRVAGERTSISKNIRSAAIDKDADLITVLNERPPNFPKRARKPGVTDALVYESELPLMVFSLVDH